jgi:phosphatidylinositol alpha-1,6-mannosyltransferase
MIFTKADRIQAISTYLAKWAGEMGAKCPVTVIPNAVDVERFSKSAGEKELQMITTKLGKKAGDVFLVTVSRLVVKNAVGDIITALTFLPPQVKLIVIGTGYEEQILRAETERMKLAERVRFLGYISHNELPAYLKVCDIFVRPSLSEGFGNSFIEAMAAGLPVIGTSVGGITDFLKDGETGLVSEVKNPRSIADKVEKLMKDPEVRDRLTENALSMVKEKYDWDRIADEMRRLMEV